MSSASKVKKNLADPKYQQSLDMDKKVLPAARENVFGGYKRLFSIKFFRCLSFLGFSNLIRHFSTISLSYI